eukprot:6324665-Prymnesium_polylepis.1
MDDEGVQRRADALCKASKRNYMMWNTRQASKDTTVTKWLQQHFGTDQITGTARTEPGANRA